jgi:hypothetical protein
MTRGAAGLRFPGRPAQDVAVVEDDIGGIPTPLARVMAPGDRRTMRQLRQKMCPLDVSSVASTAHFWQGKRTTYM